MGLLGEWFFDFFLPFPHRDLRFCVFFSPDAFRDFGLVSFFTVFATIMQPYPIGCRMSLRSHDRVALVSAFATSVSALDGTRDHNIMAEIQPMAMPMAASATNGSGNANAPPLPLALRPTLDHVTPVTLPRNGAARPRTGTEKETRPDTHPSKPHRPR